MKRYIYIVIACLALSLASCKDFLEQYSQDLTYARTIDDLKEVLIGGGYLMTLNGYTQPNIGNAPSSMVTQGAQCFPWLHLMDDDLVENCIITNPGNDDLRMQYANFHLWSPNPNIYKEKEYKDCTWNELYRHLGVVNTILSRLPNVSGDPDEKQKVEGECLFLRAYFYFFMVNTYAKPYNEATAATDLGVPLKIDPAIQGSYFSRNTVKECYDLIISDLENAATCLKDKPTGIILHANYYAVQALMSRVYLYVHQYEKSLNAANEALNGNYALVNFNSFPRVIDPNFGIKPVPIFTMDTPEVIFTQGTNSIGTFGQGLSNVNAYKVSTELLDVFSKEDANGNDLRLTFFIYANTGDTERVYLNKNGYNITPLLSSECMLRLGEVILNKAEALAMLGRASEAQTTIELLRKQRIDPATYIAISPKSGASLVEFIRDERRRELCGEGQRWFDLRRYAVHPLYKFQKEILHDNIFYEKGTKNTTTFTFKLGTYDQDQAAYVIPIPNPTIEFNKGRLVQNEPRPARQPI